MFSTESLIRCFEKLASLIFLFFKDAASASPTNSSGKNEIKITFYYLESYILKN